MPFKEMLEPEIPKAGETYIHYKSKELYIVYCISKCGNKESNQLFVTYHKKGKNEQLFTRPLEDFQKIVSDGVRRFMKKDEV